MGEEPDGWGGVDQHPGVTGRGVRAGVRCAADGGVEPGDLLVSMDGRCRRSRGGCPFPGPQSPRVAAVEQHPEVIVATPGVEFSFRRRVAGNVVVWRYRMRPEGTGTVLSESYEVLTPTPAALNGVVLAMMGVRDRHADLMDGMRVTLDRVRFAAEGIDIDRRSAG